MQESKSSLLLSRSTKILNRIILILLISFYVYISLFQLGTAPLENWDEAWYGENMKQILITGDPFVLRFNGDVFWEKPPLYMWLSMPFVYGLGLSEFSVRIASALCGIAVVAIVTLYTYKKFGIVPAIFAYIIIALNNLFVWRTRTGNLDTLSTLLILLGFFVTLSSSKYRYALFGFLVGLLYLTKLSIIFLPMLLFGIYELVFNGRDMIQRVRYYFTQYLIMLGIFILTISVWLIPGYMRVGPEFLYRFIADADKDTAKISLSNLSLDYIKFSYYSLNRRFFFVVAGGIALLLLGIKKKWNTAVFLFSTVLLAQLLFIERKNNWYILPLIPFWSMAGAYGVYTVMNWKWVKRLPFYGVGVVLVTGAALFLGYRAYTSAIVPMFSSFSSTREATTAKTFQEITNPDEVLIRLDFLYPTSIYYSSRKVLSSPDWYNGNISSGYISRDDIVKGIEAGTIRRVVGTEGDVEAFISKYQLTPVKTITPIEGERIVEFTTESVPPEVGSKTETGPANIPSP